MKKIADIPEGRCNHLEHDPPQHQVYEPGVYAHTCPGCGNIQTIVIGPKPRCRSGVNLA